MKIKRVGNIVELDCLDYGDVFENIESGEVFMKVDFAVLEGKVSCILLDTGGQYSFSGTTHVRRILGAFVEGAA